ncbi:Leucine carboxyl methyltransferase 2 [Gryllus bimaculatus]|nr:Leucine carboxyl methyltransferase 2 [Gryllus bimaculatus]
MANVGVAEKNMVNTSEQKIQYTNDYSTVSKCSTAQYGYIKDGYISELMPFTNRRSPLIHMGYYVRVVVVDSVLERFLRVTSERPAQIISLGAGFDSTFFRLSDNSHEGIVYYEVDFQEVVEKKAAILDGSELLTKLVGKLAVHPDVGFGGKNYWLLACDLRNLSALEEKMVHADVDFSLPTLFLAECSITYMDEQSSSALIRWAATKFRNATFVTYEQVYPDDGFGIVMQKHFLNQGSPLLSMQHHPNLWAQEHRYLSRDWSTCHVRSVWDVYNHLTDRNEQMRVLKIEPFDEFEEWHLKCCHYVLVVASRGSLENWAEGMFENIAHPPHIPVCNPVRWTESKVQNTDYSEGTVEIFAHGSSYVPLCRDNKIGAILLVGGFGICASGHKRIDDISVIIDLPMKESENEEINSARLVHYDIEGHGEGRSPLASMHPTCTTLKHNKANIMARVLVFGGRLSPSKVANQEGFLLHMPLTHPGSKACVTTTKLSQPGTVWDRPRARWRHTAVQIPPGGSQPWARVLVYGGRSPSYEVFGDLWMLTVAAEVGRVTFKKLEPAGPHPCGRFAHSAAALTERIGMAVSGGMNQEFNVLGDIWLYDAVEKQWRMLQLIGPEMLPRYSHTSVVYENLLIMVGGVNTLAGSQPGVGVVNLKSRTYTEYALPAQDPEKPILLHNHTMEPLTEDGSVQLIIGGGGNCFSFGTAYNRSLLKLDLEQFVPKATDKELSVQS